MSSSTWLLYGAYGHTGRMIAEEAARRVDAGDDESRLDLPILAGRDRAKVDELADKLSCPRRVFDLQNESKIVAQLAGVQAVLNCAGPFSATAMPLIAACMAAGVHYLDITGEIDAIEAAAARGEKAKEAGVTLMPAVGFDVVPSDCLALRLARRLPDACRLELAFAGVGSPSRGTVRTMLAGIRHGGRVRRNGRITSVPLAWKSKLIPFRDGPREAATIAWGDVATAWYTTAIPDIEVYAAMPPSSIRWIKRTRLVAPALLSLLPQKAAQALLRRFLTDSQTDSRQENSRQGSFWGGVWNRQGRSLTATLTTPEPYRLTVLTALASLQKTLAAQAPPGFTTPASAFGDDFILSIPGTEFRWEKNV